MRFGYGVHLPIHGAYSYRAVLETAVLADSLGFQSLWVGDHFFLPEADYKRIGGDPERPDKLDAWVTLAAVATQTENITLGTRVSPIPFYLPARLAKMVTTVDIVSNGRTVLGAGAGWHKKEAVSYGVGWKPLRQRIEMMLEGLEIIMKLWTGERTTHDGKYYDVRDAPFFPKPVQKPAPPIWFGGSSSGILDGLAKMGKGWLPTTDLSLKKFRESAHRIRELVKTNDREPSNVHLAASLSYPNGIGVKPKQWAQIVEAYATAGAQHLLLDFSMSRVSPRKAKEFLKEFADRMLP